MLLLALPGPVRLLPSGGPFPGTLHRGLVAMILLPILMASGCAGEDPTPSSVQEVDGESHFPLTLTDAAGRQIVLEEEPIRIVSLVPAATAILLALGEGDRLVGRTDYDDDPAVTHLPSVGGGIHPSLERLVALEPDLVIRFEGESDRATPAALDAMGIIHLGVRPDTVGDVRTIIRILSSIVAAEEEGDRLLVLVDGELERVRRLVAGEPRVRVAFILGGDPPWVAGRGTFLHELLEVAGATNAFGDAGPLYAPVSVEEVIRRAPELLLAPEGARIPAGLSHLPIRRVPADVQSPGPGLGRSAVEVARVIHPERGW
jgi:iron complex transport system substrate-binding protein